MIILAEISRQRMIEQLDRQSRLPATGLWGSGDGAGASATYAGHGHPCRSVVADGSEHHRPPVVRPPLPAAGRTPASRPRAERAGGRGPRRGRDPGLYPAGDREYPGRNAYPERDTGGAGRPAAGRGVDRQGSRLQHGRGLRPGDVQPAAEERFPRCPAATAAADLSRSARRAAGGRHTGDQEPVRHPPGQRLRPACDRQLRLGHGAGRRPLRRSGRQQGLPG